MFFEVEWVSVKFVDISILKDACLQQHGAVAEFGSLFVRCGAVWWGGEGRGRERRVACA